jgi:putative ABC transport system ATP-binding protein
VSISGSNTASSSPSSARAVRENPPSCKCSERWITPPAVPFTTDSDLAAYRAHEIGFVFQAFHLLPTFTALENVQIPMLETKYSASERKQHALELLRLVGLEKRVHHFPSKLSGGERQRVAIARSLANGASVLLADEPTGNLDSENAGLIMDLIVRLHREQDNTLILVTHDMGIARPDASSK